MIKRLLLCAAITSLTAGLRLRCFFERCFGEATADAQTVTLNCRVTLLLFSTISGYWALSLRSGRSHTCFSVPAIQRENQKIETALLVNSGS